MSRMSQKYLNRMARATFDQLPNVEVGDCVGVYSQGAFIGICNCVANAPEFGSSVDMERVPYTLPVFVIRMKTENFGVVYLGRTNDFIATLDKLSKKMEV